MVILAVFLLHHFLNAINFHLSDINFILVLQQLHFSLVVRFLLRGRYAIKLHIHVLDLFRLGVVNVGSSSDVLVALLNLELGCLVLFSRITLRFFCFGQLNFDVTKRILELLILNLTKPKHLAVFYLSSLLILNS